MKARVDGSYVTAHLRTGSRGAVRKTSGAASEATAAYIIPPPRVLLRRLERSRVDVQVAQHGHDSLGEHRHHGVDGLRRSLRSL